MFLGKLPFPSITELCCPGIGMLALGGGVLVEWGYWGGGWG